MDDVSKAYAEWCKSIAASRTMDELVVHLREHVGDHYNRYQRGEKVSLDGWLAGVVNLVRIFQEKDLGLTVEDLLFKLCTYYKHYGDGPAPPDGFDVDAFLANYQGPLKQFYTPK